MMEILYRVLLGLYTTFTVTILLSCSFFQGYSLQSKHLMVLSNSCENKDISVNAENNSLTIIVEGRQIVVSIDNSLFKSYRLEGIHNEHVIQDGKKMRVVYEGKKSALFDFIDWVTVRKDEKMIAFWAVEYGNKPDDTLSFLAVCEIKENEISLCEKLYEGYKVFPLYSPDGSTLTYRAVKFGDKPRIEFMIIGKQVFGPYDIVRPWPIFSRDGRRTAFIAFNFSPYGNFIVVDGKSGDTFDEIEHFTFSPDGNSTVFCAKKNKRWQIVVNGRPTGDYDMLWQPIFTVDSKNIAFVSRAGDELYLNTIASK